MVCRLPQDGEELQPQVAPPPLNPVGDLPVLPPPPQDIRGPMGRLRGRRLPLRPALMPLQMPPQGFCPPSMPPPPSSASSLPPLSAYGVAATWARSGAKALLHSFPISPSALHHVLPAHLFPLPAFPGDYLPARLDEVGSIEGSGGLWPTARSKKRLVYVNVCVPRSWKGWPSDRRRTQCSSS